MIALVLLVACSPGPSSRPTSGGTPGAQARDVGSGRDGPPQRLVAAIRGEARSLTVVAALPGGNEVRELLQSGLGVLAPDGVMRPLLGEAVPSVENGLWTVAADGSMETTWRIRREARWHDGVPLTANDLVFTVQVGQDRELGIFGHVGYLFLERITAADERTVTVRWRQPFLHADTLFSSLFAPPFPYHLLERPYREDKASFPHLPYWSEGYVGTGPFKLKEWVRGSHLLLVANEHYAPGRPKIDEVEVRFFTDPNVLVASLLSDVVGITLGRSLSLDQAVQVRDQWRNGTMERQFVGHIAIAPQFLNPNPAVIGNVEFRRALLHAVDRQALADSLQAGLSLVAESYLNPNQPEYREVEAALPRYLYDPRRAAVLLEGLGYTRGADGYRDASGQLLRVELRTSQGDDLQEKALFATAADWQQAGVAVDTVVVPPQRQQDREYRATRPGFELYRQPDDLPFLGDMHGSQTPTAENSYAGRNRSRYQNAELDALLDRYFLTIPRAERIQVVGQIVHHIADQLTILGLFYNSNPSVRSTRLRHASAASQARVTWNAHEWELE